MAVRHPGRVQWLRAEMLLCRVCCVVIVIACKPRDYLNEKIAKTTLLAAVLSSCFSYGSARS